MTGELSQRDSDEKMPIPAGVGLGRPSDAKARVVVIDEDQGIVVAIGVIPGFISPYVVTKATESCFVPAEMIHMHYKTLRPEMFADRQLLVRCPPYAANCEVVRLHSGKIQGIQLFNKKQGPGGGTPWVTVSGPRPQTRITRLIQLGEKHRRFGGDRMPLSRGHLQPFDLVAVARLIP
jgi:hypothetical protein